MEYMSNAFSLSMVGEATLQVSFIDCQDVASALSRGNVNCVIGHTDTAAIVSGILGINIPPKRENIRLNFGDILFVAQYIGPRLPEGATTLPEGAKIEFRKVVVS